MLTLAAFALAAATPSGTSYYTGRLNDPRAVYLVPECFAVRGDGVADDTAALQQAIDRVEETTKQGIVFVPEGRYRLTDTLYVWPGIRLIGYGANRPVFVLGASTPGYQDESAERYMVFFAGRRPRDGSPPDANPGTFYSALSNIDVEIGDGNPGAVGVRGRYAQHSFLAHMDFRIGSGLAGVHDTGNVMEDVRFFGGPLRPVDPAAVSGLAAHSGGRGLRRPAGGGDPGARGGAHPHPSPVPARSHRDLHRGGPLRRALGQGRPDGGRRRAPP